MTTSKFLKSFKSMRNRAVARHQLDMLSSRQLRDFNLECVTVVDSLIYR
jgi:uncharacterized protein YjiS (DUF1127 family)